MMAYRRHERPEATNAGATAPPTATADARDAARSTIEVRRSPDVKS